MIYIYLITNEVTGKYYVGQTSLGVQTRFKNHMSAARTNMKRGCKRLQRSIRKHGEKAFSVQELGVASTNEEGNALETLWITSLDATNTEVGYNLCPEGKSTRGFRWSPESRSKLSISCVGNKHGLGIPCSEEKKSRISKTLNSHVVSQETRDKIKKSLSGRTLSEEHRDKLKGPRGPQKNPYRRAYNGTNG